MYACFHKIQEHISCFEKGYIFHADQLINRYHYKEPALTQATVH
jgi:hypothetical protein